MEVLKSGYVQGSGAVVIRENKILLLQRKIEPFAGHWAIPVGHLEKDESYEETVVREVKEETGLRVAHTIPLGVNVDDNNKFETHIFRVEVSGEPENLEPHKHTSLSWFSIDEIPNKIGSTTIKALELIKQSKL
ncbi:MAG: NUDIX hydrolase [bacterium]|nr:NUDIX hydrolase [bacterium]